MLLRPAGRPRRGLRRDVRSGRAGRSRLDGPLDSTRAGRAHDHRGHATAGAAGHPPLVRAAAHRRGQSAQPGAHRQRHRPHATGPLGRDRLGRLPGATTARRRTTSTRARRSTCATCCPPRSARRRRGEPRSAPWSRPLGGVVRRAVEEDGVRFLDAALADAECAARRLDATVDAEVRRPLAARGSPRRAAGPARHARAPPSTPTRDPSHAPSHAPSRARACGCPSWRARCCSTSRSAGPSGAAGAAPRRARHPVSRSSSATVARCDPHSRGQSTQTFLFRAFLRLDAGPELSRLVPPTAAQQRRLLRFLDHACAGIS